jgi:hypothetical protein
MPSAQYWEAARTGVILLGLLCGGAAAAAAQDGAKTPRGAERFAALNWLVGEWRGFGKFAKTTSYVHKRFAYDVAGVYLTERTLDVFPPPEPSTDFELHQDLVVYYREGADGPFRAKGFYVESFVASLNVTIGEGGDSVTLESTQIENAPAGMRTRVTYARQGVDKLQGTFEMAAPGEPYRVVEQLMMQRIH